MEDRPWRPGDPTGEPDRSEPPWNARGSRPRRDDPPERETPPGISRRRGELTPPPADRRSTPRNPILPGDRAPRRSRHHAAGGADAQDTGHTERIPRTADGRRHPDDPAGTRTRAAAGPRPEQPRRSPRDEQRAPRDAAHRGTSGRDRDRARASASRRPHRLGTVARSLLAVVSLLVFGVTAYAWGVLGGANGGLTTADVLDSGTGTGPHLDGSMDILLVGMDARTDAQGHPLDPKVLASLHAGGNNGELNTDTTMLVHIPDNGKQATAISLPRDSLVERPGYGKGKLNSAFLAARNSKLDELKGKGETDKAEMNRQSKAAGARELLKTVEQLTSVKIDHYAAVNLVGFYNISKSIGGVPVCLKQDVNDPYYSGARFHKGVQSIQGKQALAFVRQRHNIPGGSTDLQRERRQQAFLASMAHKVLSAGTLTNPSRLSGLVGAVQKSLTVDPHWNLLKFARQMHGLTSGHITFTTMPVVNIDARSARYGSYVKVDPDQVAAFVKHETDPQPSDAGKPAEGSTAPSPQADNNADHSSTTVDIRNAAGVTGMASRVLDVVTSKGFTAGGTGNASSRTSTVVHYASGSKAAAEQVSDALGGRLTLQRDTSLSTGHVRVYLGTNYSGPGKQSSTGSSGTRSTGGSQVNQTSTQPPKPPKPPIVESGDGPPCVN